MFFAILFFGFRLTNTSCLTLFTGFSPGVPPKMKRGIIEENKHEQPAGTVYEMQQWNWLWGKLSFQMNFSFFFLMALTSKQSLTNPINLRNIWPVMSILFVLPRKPNLNAKKQKLVVCLKPRANALDLSTVQALNMLSSTSWAHLNTLLRAAERCWVKFETGQTFFSTRLNISFVSRSSMCDSTKSSVFAKQRSTCWAHARPVPSVSKDSQQWFNMSLCEIVGLLNMLSHFWGHLNISLNNTSTNTQHVKSLYSGQIQCICTQP